MANAEVEAMKRPQKNSRRASMGKILSSKSWVGA
jgi:hypothetical protein